MDFNKSTNNKKLFLEKMKVEKQMRSTMKQQIEAASKILAFYRFSKLRAQQLNSLIQIALPKLQSLLQLDGKIDDQKYTQACNVALIKFKEIFKPLILINKYQLTSYQIYIEALTKIITKAISWSSPQSFLQIIFTNQEYLIGRIYIRKLLDILIFNINTITLQPILNKLIENMSPFQSNLNYFIRMLKSKQQQMLDIPPYNKGLDILISSYLVNQKQKNPDLLFQYLSQSNARDPKQMLQIGQLVSDIELCQAYQNLFLNMNNIRNLDCSKSQIKKIECLLMNLKTILTNLKDDNNKDQFQEYKHQIIGSKYTVTLKLLILYEIIYIKQKMYQEYKQDVLICGEENNIDLHIQNLRLQDSYQLFLNEIKILEWFNIVIDQQSLDMNELIEQMNQLSKLILHLIDMGIQKKQEINQQLTNNLILHKYLDLTSRLQNIRYQESKYITYQNQYSLALDCKLKQIFMESLTDAEFVQVYLKQEQQNYDPSLQQYIVYLKENTQKLNCSQTTYIKQVIDFYLNLSIINLQNAQFKILAEASTELIRSLFQRDQRLKFYDWQLKQRVYDIDTNIVVQELPFIVHFDRRIQIMKQYLENDKKLQSRNPQDIYELDEDGHVVIKEDRIVEIRRDQELEDALVLENANIKNIYHIQFYNKMGLLEEGIDGGGITKEFITRVINQALDPALGLFIETSERSMMPNPHYFKEDLNKYRFIGKLIGKAIYEGILIEQILSNVFLNKVLRVKNTINDFRYYDRQEYESLCKLKQLDVSNLGLTFSINENVYGQQIEVDLISNGRDKPVTNNDKQLYLRLYVDYKLNKSIHDQALSFQSGLEEVIDFTQLRMFSHEELQLVISGNPIIDLQDLANNTQYKGYYPHHLTIQHFWQALDSFNFSEQQQFIFFFSSCSRAPTQGFKALDPPFQIQMIPIQTPADKQKLPTAQTCFNILKLPDYKDFNLLRQKLLQAIQSNTGFELT